MQSPEYPDLAWVEPRAWGKGRDGKAVRYIVIHYTAGSERATSAEDGAEYDRTRTNGVSTHYFVDRDSIVQCVRTSDRANAARTKGNRLGIQYELCGTVQTRAQWLDAASLATLRLAAQQVARDCRKYDIPVRRLSVAETRRCWTDFPAGPKGIVGHVDCTRAYPEDGGDHTDPGPEFPWDVFLDLVRQEIEGEAEMLIRKGDSGEAVKYVQQLLTELGFGAQVGDVDGDAGTKTFDGINAFRRSLGVTTTYDYLTGWTLFAMQRELAKKYAGKDGAPGTLAGTLRVDGGTLQVSTTP